jgi:hypothetical protein
MKLSYGGFFTSGLLATAGRPLLLLLLLLLFILV